MLLIAAYYRRCSGPSCTVYTATNTHYLLTTPICLSENSLLTKYNQHPPLYTTVLPRTAVCFKVRTVAKNLRGTAQHYSADFSL